MYLHVRDLALGFLQSIGMFRGVGRGGGGLREALGFGSRPDRDEIGWRNEGGCVERREGVNLAVRNDLGTRKRCLV